MEGDAGRRTPIGSRDAPETDGDTECRQDRQDVDERDNHKDDYQSDHYRNEYDPIYSGRIAPRHRYQM